MFHDVKEQFNDPRQYKTFQHINFQELLYYADDTLIIATSAGTANAYLHLIEQESEYLHLRLNHDKCNYISFNASVRRIKFWNGTMMKPTTEAKYLGAVINENIDPAHEIRWRISSTMPTLKCLLDILHTSKIEDIQLPFLYPIFYVSGFRKGVLGRIT